MNDQFCEQEAAIIRAARSGQWEPTLHSHLDECVVCREAAKVVGAMNVMVLAESAQIPPTPDPRLVWLKASFAERQKRSAAITRIAGVAYAALIAAIGLGAYSLFKSRSDSTSLGFAMPEISVTSALPAVLLIACVLLALLLSSPLSKRTL